MIVARLVDVLPLAWWRPGNLRLVGSHSLHFCVGGGVRTVEWDGREIARGRKPFPLGRFDHPA